MIRIHVLLGRWGWCQWTDSEGSTGPGPGGDRVPRVEPAAAGPAPHLTDRAGQDYYDYYDYDYYTGFEVLKQPQQPAGAAEREEEGGRGGRGGGEASKVSCCSVKCVLHCVAGLPVGLRDGLSLHRAADRLPGLCRVLRSRLPVAHTHSCCLHSSQ